MLINKVCLLCLENNCDGLMHFLAFCQMATVLLNCFSFFLWIIIIIIFFLCMLVVMNLWIKCLRKIHGNCLGKNLSGMLNVVLPVFSFDWFLVVFIVSNLMLKCRQKTMDFVAACKIMKKDKYCPIKFCHKCLLNRLDLVLWSLYTFFWIEYN